MGGDKFKLGTFVERANGTGQTDKRSFVGVVFDNEVFPLAALLATTSSGRIPSSAARSMLDLLKNWNQAFDELLRICETRRAYGVTSQPLDSLRVRPPIERPSKILCSAANYSGHLAEMKAFTSSGSGVDPAKVYSGDKSQSQAYLFLKAPSALIGAYDDIVLPDDASHQVDWEAELGVVIGDRARRVGAAAAIDHIAGFVIFNDVSCRDVLFRKDRPNFKTDWLSSKSFDSFAPCGPYLVPRQFVDDHRTLNMTLKVNGAVMQDGFAGDMIYSPEEQIEYASAMMTLEPGDIFATGTLGGVGQGTGTFLKAGDVVETTIDGLGSQANRVAAPSR